MPHSRAVAGSNGQQVPRSIARDGEAAGPPETSVIRFHDDGFSIRSPDNGFYLHPLLRVQAIYTGEVAQKGVADLAPPDTSGFSLGRAEMILEGHVGGPFFQYRFQFDAAAFHNFKDKLGRAGGTPSRLFQKVVDDYNADRYLNFDTLEPEHIELITNVAAQLKTRNMQRALDHILADYLHRSKHR